MDLVMNPLFEHRSLHTHHPDRLNVPIVGIVGGRGTGKDTAARLLVPRHLVLFRRHFEYVRTDPPESALFPNGLQLALADPLKVFVQEVLQAPPARLWGDSSLREARIPRPVFVGRSVEYVLHEDEDRQYGVRKPLQTLGTEWGRSLDEDLWVTRLLLNVLSLQTARLVTVPERAGSVMISKPPQLVVVSDLRFPNEAEMIRSAGGVIVGLARAVPPLPGDVHASEQSWRDALPDTVIDNNGSVEDLRHALQQVVGSYLADYKVET